MSVLHKNPCCGYSLESPRRGDSNEYPQHRLLWRNKKKYPFIITKYPPYLFHCSIGVAVVISSWKLIAYFYTLRHGLTIFHLCRNEHEQGRNLFEIFYCCLCPGSPHNFYFAHHLHSILVNLPCKTAKYLTVYS